jgi:hypothetical protein
MLVAADHGAFEQAPRSENVAHAGAAGVRMLLLGSGFGGYFVEFLGAGVSSWWRRWPPWSVFLQRDVDALHGLVLALLLSL